MAKTSSEPFLPGLLTRRSYSSVTIRMTWLGVAETPVVSVAALMALMTILYDGGSELSRTDTNSLSSQFLPNFPVDASCSRISNRPLKWAWASPASSSLVFCVTDHCLNAYYTVMTTVVSSNESWTDSVRYTGITWSRFYCCSSSHRRHPRSPVLG